MRTRRKLATAIAYSLLASVLSGAFGAAEPPPAPAAPAPATAGTGAPPPVQATPPSAVAQPKDIHQILDVLADAIRQKNDPMRMRMWFRVRELGGDPKVVDALLEGFVKYPEMDIKEYMVKCLSWTKSQKAYDKVLSLLSSDNVVLRRRATYEINNFDDVKAVPPLIEQLKADSDERVRVNATIALGVLDDKRAIPALKDAHKNDKSDLVRQFAKKQLELYEINYPEAKVD